MYRSVLTVVMGFLVMALITFAYLSLSVILFPDQFPTPYAIHDEYYVVVTPTTAMQVATLVLDFATAVFGGYFTAAIAPTKPRKHALALAILIGVMGLMNTISTFGSEPVVYAWVRTIVAPFLVYAGGILRERIPGPVRAVEKAMADD